MKTVLFVAAALAASGAALAQTTTDTATTQSTSVQTGTAVAAGNTAPKRDARGIPVVSDPATAPAGVNAPPGPVATDPTTAFATQPSTENYPVCSRSVTDNCVQNYERSRPR